MSQERDAEMLWATGEMTLRLRGPGLGAGRLISIHQPYARLGRAEGTDIRLDDLNVSTRHAYLHLDARGLFVVDLATRTGLRFNDVTSTSGWLRPGQTLEIASRRIEVVSLEVNGVEVPSVPYEPLSLLADTGPSPLCRLSLRSTENPDTPWTVNSELLFLGRSPSCGVRVAGEDAARIHCVIVRSISAAYLIDLSGRGSRVNDRLVYDAAPLAHGDEILLGTTRFNVQLAPSTTTAAPQTAPPVTAAASRPTNLAMTETPGFPAELLNPMNLPTLPNNLVPAESQAAVLGWMMGVLQATQSEMMRRQDDFQREVVQAIHLLREDNDDAMKRHLKKVERIQRELGSLREEVRNRFGSEAIPVEQPSLPKPPPLRIPTTPAPSADPATATAWLLNRVNQLDAENRSSWRDLISRTTENTPRDNP